MVMTHARSDARRQYNLYHVPLWPGDVTTEIENPAKPPHMRLQNNSRETTCSFNRQCFETAVSFNWNLHAITVVSSLAPSVWKNLRRTDQRPIVSSTAFHSELEEELCEACMISEIRTLKPN